MMEKQTSQIFVSSSNMYKRRNSRSLSNSESLTNKGEADKSQIKLNLFYNVNERFDENLFLHGKKVGKIEGIINIENIPLIKQIICGVHTENGLDNDSSYLGLINKYNNYFGAIGSETENTVPKQVQSLYESHTLLLNQLSNNSSVTQLNQDSVALTTSILSDIISLLSETSKESVLFYTYHNTADIMKGQEIMIDLGIRLISFINSLNVIHRNKAFKILTLILDRGEFDLEMMTIIISEKLEKYNNICEHFIKILKELLAFSIDHIGKRSVDDITRQFIEHMLAVAYFRIPPVINNFLI